MAPLITEKPSLAAPISTITTTPINPSTDSLPSTTHPTAPSTYDPTSTDPFSPFYSHARASESNRRLHQHTSSTAYEPQQLDLEKGGHGFPVTVTETHKSTLSARDDPNKPSLLCKCQAKRSRGCWKNMSKRQRVLVHVLLALVFIGAVTGLGLGVSKAMGTGIWKGTGGGSAGLEDP